MKPLSKELLKVLACPSCKSDVKLSKDELTCTNCHKHFKIKEGIPVMM